MSRIYDHGGNVFGIARQYDVSPMDVADFSASINPLGLSPMAREAITSAIDNLVHYPDTGQQELKKALSDHHGLSPANIVAANGSTELIYQLPAILSGTRAMIISPSFSEYGRALTRHGWDIRPFVLAPEEDFSIDVNKLQMALADRIDALYLCNPGNPNGTLYPLQLIDQICDICRRQGVFLVIDEAFMDFCEDASAKHCIVHNNNAIILRSMTKFHGIPGLRLGYAIACEALAERLDAEGIPWNVNTLALKAGVAALQDARHNQQTIDFVTKERFWIIEQLGRVAQLKVYPSSVNFLLVEIVNGMTAKALAERLLGELIVIRDCASFTGLTPSFFRIAVRTRKENERLVKCLGKIFEFE